MDWERIRSRLRAERTLLRELALMLAVALVVGLYFLEHLESRLQEREQLHAQAQASQVASAAAEYLAAEDRVSLAVLARRSAGLESLQRVELLEADGERLLAQHGPEADGGAPHAQRPVLLDDGEVAGVVRVWLELPDAVRARLEAGFVLIVLCLLALRVVVGLLYRRVAVARAGGQSRVPGSGAGDQPDSDAGVHRRPGKDSVSCPEAWLWLVPANRRHLEQRYTPSLLRELFADHRDCLERVAQLHGGTVEGALESGVTVVFRPVSGQEAAFSALCAGQLFLELSRRLNHRRRDEGRPSLEFKLLVSTDQDAESARYCCESGWPGRVQMLLDELERLRLDARVLYRESQALEVVRDDEEIRVQPVEQLARRYQKLIEEQASRLEQEMSIADADSQT